MSFIAMLTESGGVELGMLRRSSIDMKNMTNAASASSCSRSWGEIAATSTSTPSFEMGLRPPTTRWE
jgi:hypothetical protein